jgi:hypothetical protein
MRVNISFEMLSGNVVHFGRNGACGREPGSGDLRVMLLSIRADADRPDHFTIDDDREH